MDNLCETCNKTFSSKSNLNNHIKVFHDNTINYPCAQCSRKFKRRYEWRDHVEKNHSKFTCVTCLKIFKHKNHLRNHVEFFHESKLNFSCKQCNRKFRSKSSLQSHTSRKHRFENKVQHQGFNKEEPDEPISTFDCKKCSKTFLNSTLLRKHKFNCSKEGKMIEKAHEIIIESSINESERFEQTFSYSNEVVDVQDNFEVENSQTEFITDGNDEDPDIIIETPLDDCDTDEEFSETEAEITIKKEVTEKVSNSAPLNSDPDVIIETPLDDDTSESDFEETEEIENLPEISKDPDIIVENVKIEKNLIKCKPCNQNFESELDLGVHIGLTHSVTVMKCPKCTKLLMNQREFLAHEC